VEKEEEEPISLALLAGEGGRRADENARQTNQEGREELLKKKALRLGVVGGGERGTKNPNRLRALYPGRREGSFVLHFEQIPKGGRKGCPLLRPGKLWGSHV